MRITGLRRHRNRVTQRRMVPSKVAGLNGERIGRLRLERPNVPEVSLTPCRTALPFMYTVNQTFGPSSTEDHANETCVGPTSVTETFGLVGEIVSAGSVNVTVLLYPE